MAEPSASTIEKCVVSVPSERPPDTGTAGVARRGSISARNEPAYCFDSSRSSGIWTKSGSPSKALRSVYEEWRRRGGERPEPLGFAFDHVAARAVEHVAVACQRDSGHEQLLPGEPAEFSVRLVHPGDRSGNSDRAMARER